MATITGLTAERMLEIEAASVVDGDVVGNDLILARQDGTVINAGNVRGPAGPTGPMGSALSVVSGIRVAEIGELNQIRAGRQLTPADFTNMGLSAPLALWNLSNFSDSSGNARHLTNKGSVPLGVGINGLASTAAVFSGSTAQALYIPDAASGPFALRTGTVGIWHRTSKKGYSSYFFVRSGVPSGTWSWYMGVQSNGTIIWSTFDGANPLGTIMGNVDVCDDRWHFLVATFDGSKNRFYVDGIFEGQANLSAGLPYTGAAPVNIGGYGADGSTATSNPSYGRMSNAFICSEVLSEEQVRNLYCASFSHTLAAVPSGVSMSVQRKRRGAALATTDFSAQPLRLYNFTGGSLADQGSLNTTLQLAGPSPVSVAAPDGTKDNAFTFGLATNMHFATPDTGLPAGLAARSFGAWFKGVGAAQAIIGWGTYSTGFTQMQISSGGVLGAGNNTDVMAGPFVADGLWHFAVVVEDNAAADGIKRKLYLDGRCVGNSLVMNPIVLAGVGRFRIGAQPDGTAPFVGSIDAGFVCNYALTIEQIRALYDKSSQALAASPKAAEDHIEAMESGRLLGIFDTIESSDSISLAVMA